jgi:hypothetical protein
MTSAEIYRMICDMLGEYLSERIIWTWGETAVCMYVYAACAFYPQADDGKPTPIQCTV